MATLKGGHRGVPPSSGRASGRDGPERQPDGRRLIANRPSSAAVKYTYGPRIRAIFDKWYGLVHNTEQRAAAIGSNVLPRARKTLTASRWIRAAKRGFELSAMLN